MSKAQISFTAGNTMTIIIVLIMVMGTLSFITGNWQGINSFLEDVCNKNPNLPICTGNVDVSSGQREVAAQSTEALACAIKSVWTGKTDLCGAFKEPDPASVEMDLIEVSVKCPLCRDAKKCTGDGTEDDRGKCYEEVCKDIPGCKITYADLLITGSNWLSRTITTNECICRATIPKAATVDCSKAGSGECTVKNFRLPQYVTPEEGNIPFYGDPEFLVYWENFPPEEDTWTFHTNWKLYAVIAIVSTVPWGKSLKLITKGASKVVGKGIGLFFREAAETGAETVIRKTVTTEAIEKYTQKAIINSYKKGVLSKVEKNALLSNVKKITASGELDDIVLSARGKITSAFPGAVTLDAPGLAQKTALESTSNLMDNALSEAGLSEKVAGSSITKNVEDKLMLETGEIAAAESLKEAAKLSFMETWKSEVTKQVAKRPVWIAAKAGALSAAAATAEIVDSMFNVRFVPVPNSLVLKETLNDPLPFAITDMKGYPVLVKLKNRAGKSILPQLWPEYKQLHLVSPCHLAEMRVIKTSVVCPYFTVATNEADEKLTSCFGSVEPETDGPSCEDYDEYEIGDLGQFEFLENLKTIPDYLSVIYNDKNAIDEGEMLYPSIEYQEDNSLFFRWKKNVFYHFEDGKWKWKSPAGGVDDYRDVPAVSDLDKWKDDYQKVYRIDTVHFYIFQRLSKAETFEEGLDELEDILNTGIDGVKTKDDELTFYFRDEESITIDVDNLDEMSDIEPVDNTLGPGYYIIPFAENKVLFYKPEKRQLKLGVYAGEKLETYDFYMTKEKTPGLTESQIQEGLKGNIFEATYAPIDYSGDDVEEIELLIWNYEFDHQSLDITPFEDAIDAKADTWMRITGSKSYRSAIVDTLDTTKKKVALSTGVNEIGVVFSDDENNDGITRSISLYYHPGGKGAKSARMKVMTDDNYDVDGFEQVTIGNCITDGVVVEMGEKAGADPNYCAGGLSTGTAIAEFGGDLAMAAGVAVAVFSGGSLAGPALTLGGAIESITEINEMKALMWPNSDWETVKVNIHPAEEG